MRDPTSTAGARLTLDTRFFSGARAAADGRVYLDLEFEGQSPRDDVARFAMTPGQALALIQQLASAAQRALQGAVS